MRARLRRLRGRPQPLRAERPDGLLEVLRDGPAPLDTGRLTDRSLRVAVLIPQFRRGSGGHSTIANLLRGLEDAGHDCSLWLLDGEGRHAGETEVESAALFREFFGPLNAPLRRGVDAWTGADVVVATGWQTVPRALALSGCRARAYLVQDHEPDFYPASAERLWAEWTYRQDLHCICASPWLAALVRERYGAAASAFDLGVDHDRYAPRDLPRRDDLVLLYARAVTPRRAVPLALLALDELARRRPGVEIALFGESRPVDAPFPHTDRGVLDDRALSELYSSATASVVLSLTNPSLVPTEMLACGLPCVDVAVPSTLATFGAQGPVTLAEPDPVALCAALVALLDDPAQRAERSAAGVRFAAGRSWPAAAAQVEAGLRASLAR